MHTLFTSSPFAHAGNAFTPVSAGVRRSVGRVGAGLWNLLEAIGQARAHSHLLAMADRREALQPELARALRAAAHQGPMA